MKAAVWHGVKDIRVEDVELKELRDDEVTIKVAWTGICGSDLHEYLEGPVFIPVEKEDELTGGLAPLTMGHEFSGVIEAVGKDVTKYKVGDHVAVNPTITKEIHPDGDDVYDGYSFIGLSTDGGLAPYVNVPEGNLYILPSDFPLDLAATIEPAAVAVQAVVEGDVKPGDSVAVFGAGPIGVLTVAAAKAMGAKEVIAIDLSAERLEKAKIMGATHTINPKDVNAVEEIRKIVPYGVDSSFEVAGVQPTFEQAISATRPRGIVTIVSIFAHPIQFNPMQLMNAGVKITSTIAYSHSSFQKTVDLITSGKLDTKPLITKKIELEDIVPEGFETLTVDKLQTKVLVKLSGE